MRTPVALVFALGLYWMGLNQGAESPDSNVSDFVPVAVVLVIAAVAWEIGVRVLRSRRDRAGRV
ncbi:hypothetical protein AFL01nite_29970 [Aeromicrobium flavum]|uniref:Uncharacterized protein n=1 Tax=Aeromicrobium flavum TaxID=416568 RepID=A0A512HZ61_9ACTN|nr:hypothetical protein [Aeromicrobium flavum]GEO90670.1 hypothetical protein AFL01nite_29970 [Aeromicrobium flavum]